MRKRPVREIAETVKTSLTPLAYPSERFNYYSIPDLDEANKPSVVEGREIASAKNLVADGTVLVSKLNPRIKRVWRVGDDQGRRSLASTEFIAVRPTRPEDVDYLFYALHSDELWTHLKACAIGSTNSHTRCKPKDLEGFELCLAEPDDRSTIARILGTVDGLIERTEALIAKQQQIKQGLLHDLFTRGVDAHGALRPPQSEAPELYHQTELGWVPRGWSVDALNTGLELLTDYEANGSFEVVKLNVKVYDEPNYAWYVRATDLEQGYTLDQVRYVDKRSYDFLTKTTLAGGEVAVTKRGEIGKVYRIPHASVPITLAPNMYLLRLNDRISPDYLYHYFKSARGQHQLLRNNASTTVGALYKDDVKAMRVPFAPPEEQTRIAARLDQFEQTMRNEIAQVAKLRSLKTGLMQDLLTGRVGVEGVMERAMDPAT